MTATDPVLPARPLSMTEAETLDNALWAKVDDLAFWSTHGPDGEWVALQDLGDRKQKPAVILEAGDTEIRLPADYPHGAIATFAAQARAMFPQMLAVVRAVMSRHRLRGGTDPVCTSCTEVGRDLIAWPCEEVREIAPLLDVDVEAVARRQPRS